MPSARPLVPILLLLICGGFVQAADEAPAPAVPVGAEEVAPPVPTVPAITPAADLLKQLPAVSCLIERDGKAMWVGEQPEPAYQVISVDKDQNAVIKTDLGELTILRRLLIDNRVDAISTLPTLLAHVKGAKLATDDLIMREGIITGLHLFSAKVLVIDEGVLNRVDIKDTDRKDQRKAVVDAAAGVVKAAKKSGLDEVGRKALEDVLQRCSGEDGNEKVDEVSPSFARRLIRGGWLRGILNGQAAAVTTLEQAIAEAEKFEPVMAYEGTGLKLAEVSDSFGRRNRWILTTSSRSSYVQSQETPLYYWALPNPGPTLAVDLKPGSDPTAVSNDIERVRLFQGYTKLVEWTKASGFNVDEKQWRKVYPTSNARGIDENAVSNVMPPHVVITALNGDIIGLQVPNGRLVPPKSGAPEEAERFLADAAKLLPDPAYLDLIGEYILAYVYDSPDTRFPYLVGNRQVKGDIHQTAAQTIATATCGMIRGDCDDLSELYQAIAERQGRTAHVISLPQHAAAAFAEKKEDGNWYAYTLQTGPALEFKDEKLQVALRKLYESFDDGDAFDPNGLGLLLRFSGENTRGQWRLSYRIFSEQDYAKTMIDVQRDWQYQTYQRAIIKMLKMIEGDEKTKPDEDNANFRELSGLYSFTGEYDKAVEYHEEAMKRTEDPENLLGLKIELLQHLFDAKQDSKAKTVALELLDKDIPKLLKDPARGERMQAYLPSFGTQMCATMVHGKAYDLALRALKDTMLKDITSKITQVGGWLTSPRFNQRAWDNAPQLLQIRRQLLMYTGIAVEILAGSDQDALVTNSDLQSVARSVQDWLNNIAFHDVDEPEDVLMRYAVAGQFYAAMLGEDNLAKLIDAVELPKENNRDHSKRIGGLAQVQLDLPWIKMSTTYWTGKLMKLFERGRTTLDKSEVAINAKNAMLAYHASKKLGLEANIIEHNAHIAQVIAAVIGGDEKLLRERLRWVKEKNDKRLRDDTAQWLGDVARFVPVDAYKQVIKVWQEELNYKPKWFWIAWRAALNGAPDKALLVAEAAKNEFKDDLSFAEEYNYMKKLFAAPK